MKRHLPILLLVACAVFFAATLYFLLKSRFEVGDVYPPASSLRSDPLGTMIFYESLAALPDLRVERDHSPFNRLPDGNGTTYLHLAADHYSWTNLSAETYRIIEQFLLEGGRLVITLTPNYATIADPEEEKAKNKKDSEKESDKDTEEKEDKDPKESDKDDTKHSYVSLEEKWGLLLERPERKEKRQQAFDVKNISPLPLPSTLQWHGDIVLKDPSAAWQIIYNGPEGPVLAEMKRGPGQVVIATDSYFVSNEALVRDRSPELLAWLIGPNHHVVFDEAHLGIMESPGIAALARKYRLLGGAAALFVLAALFIWKNSSRLAPLRQPADFAPDQITGRDAASGYVALLRRNIPPDRILDACLDEWQKSFAHGTKFSAQDRAKIEDIISQENARPPRERDPVKTYQTLCAALKRNPTTPAT